MLQEKTKHERKFSNIFDSKKEAPLAALWYCVSLLARTHFAISIQKHSEKALEEIKRALGASIQSILWLRELEKPYT